MKKIIIMVILVLLVLTLSSCFLKFPLIPKKDIDHEYADRQLSALLEAMVNKDRDSLKSLFSKNTLASVQNIDQQIENLFTYFKGTNPSFDESEAPHDIEEAFEYGERQVVVGSSYDVSTSETIYRISFKACRVDTVHKDNVGIWSVYIILFQDDDYPEHAYWADGENTPGINIGVPQYVPDDEASGENFEYQPYSREEIEQFASEKDFGKGVFDAEKVVLQYIYNNDELEEKYGKDFCVSDYDGWEDSKPLFFVWFYHGKGEYSVVIGNDTWIVKVSKGCFGKWEVTDCYQGDPESSQEEK